MEFKKKTIIWEDNNEPPKSYIWAKKDGKFYEYSTTKGWTESKLISSNGSSSEDVLSKFNEYKESLERDGYIYEVSPGGELDLLPIEMYDQMKDQLPLNTTLYGNPETAVSMAAFVKPNSENPEDLESASYAIVFLSEEEEPEEVMPHDGMDPDAGGGEDIVEEDETTTDPPIPEETEEP